jgi:hypothetical protein
MDFDFIMCSLSIFVACWRTYYLSRPRVLLDGCYIAKMSYAREGEKGFQDSFYRAWHVVRYFRYIRFFAGGHVSMLTSADEPVCGVKMIASKTLATSNVQGLMTGHYRIVNNLVIGVLKTPKSTNADAANPRFKRSRRNSMFISDVPEQEFHFVR